MGTTATERGIAQYGTEDPVFRQERDSSLPTSLSIRRYDVSLYWFLVHFRWSDIRGRLCYLLECRWRTLRTALEECISISLKYE